MSQIVTFLIRLLIKSGGLTFSRILTLTGGALQVVGVGSRGHPQTLNSRLNADKDNITLQFKLFGEHRKTFGGRLQRAPLNSKLHAGNRKL